MMVDRSKWSGKKNRGAPRFLTRDKDVDLRKQLDLSESLGVIEKSIASEYSQVHLVRKPDNGWRLCIDFKKSERRHRVHGDLASSECGLNPVKSCWQDRD